MDYEYEYEYNLPDHPRRRESKPQPEKLGPLCFHFGKHRGQEIKDVPTGYLNWYLTLEPDARYDNFRFAVLAELKFRRSLE